jgi:hypothetical protein
MADLKFVVQNSFGWCDNLRKIELILISKILLAKEFEGERNLRRAC